MSDEELKGMFETLRQELAAVRQENAAEHAETRRRVGALDKHIGFFHDALAISNQQLTREIARLEDKMDRGFTETHELIRFTYSHLNRRVTKLEKSGRKS